MAVLVMTQRQTALVAKQAAEVDVLSDGRLRLGIGVGWSRDEFENLGQDFHTRGRRAEEQLAVLKALWTEEIVTFHGEWHRISEAGINPLPVQRPIPIWIGGNSEPVLRRIARHGDGWLPEGRPEPELKELVERLRRYTAEAGREPAAIAIEGRTSLRSHDPDQWAEALATWQRVGADGVSVTTHNAGCKTIDDHIALLRRFRETAGA
jgi:probable F420-dependent oxidoreductase